MAGDLPPGAFVPSHGRGWLRPAKPFVSGDPRARGNKAHADFKKPRARQAAYALRKLFPALWEAMRAPAPTQRSWWRKRQAAFLRDTGGNQQATEHKLLSLLLLRMPVEPKPSNDRICQQCNQPFGGDAPLPLIVGALVSAWVHPRCLAPAMQAIVMKARSELAKALEPYSHNAAPQPPVSR